MLVNPGKGWVQYYGTDKYTDDYISIGYNRWGWSVIESEENKFNWEVIDDFIRQFKRHGKKIAFGVMNVSTGLGQYVTPKWVFDAGAASVACPDASSPTGQQIIPKTWDDPVFLQKMKAFIQALGKRYDGHPDIAFLDIRSYGNWGEGHVGFLNIPDASPESYHTNYLQPYITAFPHTQLIVPYGHSGNNAVYDWAVTQGCGMRRDGILSKWSKDGSECLRAHGRQPAVFEYCDGYAEMKRNGWWKPDMLRSTYFAAGKPSYLQWNSQIFEENRDFCLSLGNYVGYHFILEKVILPTSFRPSVPFQVQFEWLNDGVAYLYEPCHVAIALLDSRNDIKETHWIAESHPKSWTPGQSKTETFDVRFTSASAGSYKLAVGLFLDRKDVNPAYRLGIQGRTSDGWYVLYDRLEYKP